MTNQSEQAKGLEEVALIFAKKQVYRWQSKNSGEILPHVLDMIVASAKDAYIAGSQSQPGIKQWVSDIISELSEVIDEQADRQRFGMDHTQGVNEGLRMAIRRLDKIPNSTTPKSDMVSKADVIGMLQTIQGVQKYASHIGVIQECITKIKEI